MSHTNTYKFLMIDNGAAISIMNESIINPDQIIVVSDKCKIKGVTHGEVETFGKASTPIVFGDGISVNLDFQVVSADFPLQVDGILGRDFLKKVKANIDYSTYLLDFNYDSYQRATVPLHDKINDDNFFYTSKS